MLHNKIQINIAEYFTLNMYNYYNWFSYLIVYIPKFFVSLFYAVPAILNRYMKIWYRTSEIILLIIKFYYSMLVGIYIVKSSSI
jgi:hypothetical protein